MLIFNSAVLTQIIIKFLHVGSCDERYRLIPNRRFYIPFRIGFITVQRTLTDGAGHILGNPFVEPLAEGHFTVLGQLGISELINFIMEFVDQFLLCFCVDIAEDGIAVFLMAYDDATFPLSFFLLANHSFA